ncbi:hypothetical protein [Clostridium thermarum]|uniref:hypothetical protein n=1 Tax=Clostridium thermarum TaxID=1716543 RepID=UPI00112458EA|nr:hypothetical protein [Clostridium thermarum]
MAKKKTVKDKQRAKLKAVKRKEKKQNKVNDGILYICTNCGTEELIPENIVQYFDIVDDGDINEPPTFSCESCGGIMRPAKYEGVHGITYEF